MGIFKKNGMLDRRYNSNKKGFDASSRYQWKMIFIFIGLGFVIYQMDSCGFIDIDDGAPVEEWDGTWDGHNVRP